jgi:hypothetical protein
MFWLMFKRLNVSVESPRYPLLRRKHWNLGANKRRAERRVILGIQNAIHQIALKLSLRADIKLLPSYRYNC